MYDNLYLAQKKPAQNGPSIFVVIGGIIIILLVIIVLLFFLGDLLNKDKGSTDNSQKNNITSAITTSTDITPEISEEPLITYTTVPTITEITSPTPTGNFVRSYFYKSPIKPMQDTDEVYPFNRYTSETNLVPFAIGEFFKGPNPTEKAAGYILPFTLSGSSACGGSTYKYNYTSSTVKLTICKQIDPIAESGDGGGYAGSSLKAMARVLKAITSSLKVGSISKVEVYDKTGACYAPDTGLNGCTP